MTPRRRRLGLRREAVILLPAVFVLLAVVAVATLVAYRGAVDALVEARRAEALALAGRAADELATAGGGDPTARLAAAVPAAAAAALVAGDGRVLARVGRLPPGDPLAPLSEAAVAAPDPEPVAVGPAEPEHGAGDRVIAFAPLGPRSRRAWVRVDLEAPVLAAERLRLGRLGWVVGGAVAALGILVLTFASRLVAPYEALLARARAASAGGGEEGAADDEIAFLVDTFERALAARDAEGDLGALGRTLAASFSSGVLVLDRGGRLLAANPEAAELLDLPAGELGPEPPVERVLAPHPPLVRLVGEALAGAGPVRRREVALEGPDGTITLGVTVHPLRQPEGEIRGYLVQFADLTEVRRRAERERLADNLLRLGELSAGVAHELRNSLATLRGHLELIGRDLAAEGPTAPGVDESLAEMRREAEHLERVLEDFLGFARPGSARATTVDLATLARRAAADPALGGAPVVVRGARPVHLTGDPQLLERLLRNLLRNAVEATREAAPAAEPGAAPQPIEVAIERTAERVVLTVADRGPGVSPAMRERLFLPFASGRAGGVGLGLALAQRIALLHEGRLALEDRPGGGTVARLELPAGGIVTDGSDRVEPPDEVPPWVE